MCSRNFVKTISMLHLTDFDFGQSALVSDCYSFGKAGETGNRLFRTSSVWGDKYFRGIAPEISYQMSRIDRMRAYGPDWAGQGSIGPNRRTLIAAKEYVYELGRIEFVPRHVGAGPDGEILVEYQVSESREVEIFFQPNGRHELLLANGDETVYDGPLDAQVLIDFLYGREH